MNKNKIKGIHLCAGGTSSAFLEIFFRKNYLNFLNKLYVILNYYFSILLSNFFKSVILSLIFTQGVVCGLLKK